MTERDLPYQPFIPEMIPKFPLEILRDGRPMPSKEAISNFADAITEHSLLPVKVKRYERYFRIPVEVHLQTKSASSPWAVLKDLQGHDGLYSCIDFTHNAQNYVPAKRMTIAHECGHIVLKDIKAEGLWAEREGFCEYFGLCLLTPAHLIHKEIESIREQPSDAPEFPLVFDHLYHKTVMPPDGLGERLINMGYIDDILIVVPLGYPRSLGIGGRVLRPEKERIDVLEFKNPNYSDKRLMDNLYYDFFQYLEKECTTPCRATKLKSFRAEEDPEGQWTSVYKIQGQTIVLFDEISGKLEPAWGVALVSEEKVAGINNAITANEFDSITGILRRNR